MKHLIYTSMICILWTACASTTEQGTVGVTRQQYLFGASTEEVNDMALEQYLKVKQDASSKKTLDTNTDHVRRVKTIADRLIPHTTVFRNDAPSWGWETHVITSPELNAYCMPGGKIVFYSGIIEKLNMTDGEIAAVMGHEIAHALREHGRERVAQAKTQQVLLGLGVATGKISQNTAQYASVGAQILMTLPNSRGQESEADDIGVELMARAGFDPQEAVSLWMKMANAAGGAKALAFLSTHPSSEQRIRDIQNLIPKVKPLYLNAVKKYETKN